MSESKADWLQIHIDYIHKGKEVTARCSMSGDKRLSPIEVTATLSSVCSCLSGLSGIPFDEKAFRENVKLGLPWWRRIFR